MDDYIQWLVFYNAGMLDRGNIHVFKYVMENIPSDKPMLEIGAFCGLTTNLITHFKRMYNVNNKFISVDAFDYDPKRSMRKIPGVDLTFLDFNEKVLKSYMDNVSLFSKQNMPYSFKAFSNDFFNDWGNDKSLDDLFGKKLQLGGEICFAFIDGDHSYEGAKSDFENCDKYLEQGGFLFFDDSADESEWPVKRVISDVKKTGRYEVVMKNPNYLFRKIK